MTKKEKLFYVEYSLQFDDGIEEFKSFLYAESEIEAHQIINQIAFDLKADDKFIDVVEEDHKWRLR
jgi:hypothetical protein